MPEIWFPNLGIEIAHLDRVAFTVFGRNVYWYGIFIGLAVVLGVLMAMKEAKRTGQSPDMYVDFIIYALIFAIIGARLYYVIFSWDFYSAHPEKIFALREGGLAIYGGIIGGVVTAIVYCKRKGVNFWLLADTIAPCLAFGQMLGRWGNFFNREAFGEYTDSLFAMRLPIDAVRSSDVTEQMRMHIQSIGGVEYIQVHPTFLYESLWCCALLIILFVYRKHKKYEGELFLLYMFGYGLGRVWIEGLRTDQLILPVVGLPVSQLLAGVLVVVMGILIVYLRKHHSRYAMLALKTEPVKE